MRCARYPAASHTLRRLIVWATVLTAFAVLVRAHPAGLTAAHARIHSNGEVTIQLTFDVLAATLNDTPERISDDAMRELVAGPRAELERRLEETRRRFERQLVIRVDGKSVPATTTQFPTADEIRVASQPIAHPNLPILLKAEYHGAITPGNHVVQIAFPEVIGPLVLSTERSGAEPSSELLAAGQDSAPESIDVGATAASPTVAKKISWTRVAAYVRLGYTHILPHGLDHILFILGLLVFARSGRALVGQVTAFTLAHTVTLGLALYGVVRVPASIVEPLIALSIAAVALDNVFASRLRAWRVFLVFGFGLVHGLGFAGALEDLGISRSELLPALVGFNAGVELGQLTIVAVGWGALAWVRPRPQYRAWCAIPASVCIGLIAVGWTAVRLAH